VGYLFLLNQGDKTMKINPIRDKILVSVEDKESTTASGIFIPDNVAEKPLKGKVIAVGTGKISEDGTIVPLVIKEGDNVLFGKHAGQTVKVSDTEYLIMTEDDIMAVIH
jgi:chaperonin GroES